MDKRTKEYIRNIFQSVCFTVDKKAINILGISLNNKGKESSNVRNAMKIKTSVETFSK
jgi:hypothetical protein